MTDLSENVQRSSNSKKYIACHLTTAHDASDVRIYERECKSIAAKSDYAVIFVSHGQAEKRPNISHISLGQIPKTRLRRLIKSQITWVKVLTTIKADVWHLHDPELLLFGCLLTLLKKRVIWDAHEDYFLQFRSFNEYRTYIPNFLRVITKHFVLGSLSYLDKHATGVISATKSINETYNNRNRAIVGNEARIEEFTECNPRFQNNRVLFTGAANQAQSFREVVKAIAQLDNLILTVAGKEVEREEWVYAKSLLGERLLHLGWLNRIELSEAITQSKIGLITYSNLETNRTNSPNKRFEFSAGGLPCVVTPTMSNTEWVNDSSGAILAEGFEAIDLVKALKLLNESEHEWNQISLSTRSWSRKFGSWSNSEALLLKVYEESRPKSDICEKLDS